MFLFFYLKNILSKYLFLLIFSVLISSCTHNSSYEEPKISLDNYYIEEGFDLKAVATEPFIEAPVTMDFDNQGRMWVVEMKGYMQNLEGTNANIPNGRITILEDLDNDGITDHSKVFLDSLVLPRAIAHVYGGLLYAEPPNLWFVEIENDKPKNKVLVDAKYTHGGNVEHQPNGLMMNIDNWIYNAKSKYRYQKKNKKWIKEKTYFRGQWGISKDNFGRIYYNNNSIILRGDIVLPNTHKNPNFKSQVSLGRKLAPNRRVYPLHATSINRGYIKGRLDKDSLLINITSACGPLIYRGDQFPKEYLENAFICAPEANIVKRAILSFAPTDITARQATPKKEFLASTDEGFRPVNLFNGPDGNMYIVDMHRGILQDKSFMTDYLKKHYKKKQLDTIIGMGRILKVQRKKNLAVQKIQIELLSLPELVNLLKHPNGWYRDKAQQLLIHKQDSSSILLLKKMIKDSKSNSITQIHALHTLNGLNALSFNFLEQVIVRNNKSSVTSHAIVLLEQFASPKYLSRMLQLTQSLKSNKNHEIDIYLSNSLGDWTVLSPEDFFPILLEVSNNYKNNPIFQEGIMSSIRGLETNFYDYIKEHEPHNSESVISIFLDTYFKNKKHSSNNKNKISNTKNIKSFKAGKRIFKHICATCHGINGDGISNLAPPFKNSEYISKSLDRLALVILHGLSGPIHVNGVRYNLNATMPGLNNNSDHSNKDIQNLIRYIRSEFSEKEGNISLKRINYLRKQKPKNGVYSEKELLEY